jgi:hypothetical protein
MSNEQFSGEPWVSQRRAALHKHADGYHDGTKITDIVMAKPPELPRGDMIWHDTRQFMLERVEYLHLQRGDSSELTVDNRHAIKQQLRQEHPALERLIAQRRQTVVIAANDDIAHDFAVWMKYTGRTIPADMSLISFDNQKAFALQRFSSMDFGFAAVGYLVAHRFIGDIPVCKDANGNITTEPSFVDRGSIVAPSTHRKRA